MPIETVTRPDEDRIDRSFHHPAEDVPSVLIRSKPVGPAGGLKAGERFIRLGSNGV